MGLRPRAGLAGASLLALVAGAVAVVLAVSGGSPPRDARTATIAVGERACARGWQAPTPGLYEFRIENRSKRVASISLFASASGVVVARLAASAPGSVAELSYRLTRGSAYTWSCQLAGLPRQVSAAAEVPLPHARFVPYTPPVAARELVAPLRRYRRYVDGLLAVERRQVAGLVRAARAGDPARTRSRWLAAHLTWLEIGEDDGAYGSFGELGRRIDGTAAGLVEATTSPEFTGFHKVEFDLWTRRDLGAAAADSARLAGMIDSLTPGAVRRDLPTSEAAMGEWTLRCHEILEDALRDSLSADDDYGSNTDLASLTADVAATREMLSLLGPLIAVRVPGLVRTARRELATLAQAAAATRRTGRWIAIVALPLAERERVDGATDAALQTLAPVSELMQIGNT